ncbi:hypothetical protein RF11_00341 [Thelohanellus kitauei]|uniref:Uncharacterized protein n=1 Tax=Thelohanellus kitauei TaxID=669202 RepID=A0A0C2MG96_THEKT|nr:hypothetical protein RF11_00341 [Thelohanellus kitauei]
MDVLSSLDVNPEYKTVQNKIYRPSFYQNNESIVFYHDDVDLCAMFQIYYTSNGTNFIFYDAQLRTVSRFVSGYYNTHTLELNQINIPNNMKSTQVLINSKTSIYHDKVALQFYVILTKATWVKTDSRTYDNSPDNPKSLVYKLCKMAGTNECVLDEKESVTKTIVFLSMCFLLLATNIIAIVLSKLLSSNAENTNAKK